MPPVLMLAYKLLVTDRAKFAALVIGLTFSVFLMVQMTSIFSGVLQRASATVINMGAPIWVMDPAVMTVANSIPLPDYVLDAVRSMNGVEYAVPLYSGGALARLSSGTYQAVNVIGLDDTSLFGRPNLLEGRIEDLYGDDAYLVVHDSEFAKLESPAIGTSFEINDHRAVVVGIAEVPMSALFGVPTLYTTYRRAIEDIPSARFTLSYVLVQPRSPADLARIQDQVAKLGYRAVSADGFMTQITSFYVWQTGVGMNLLIMTVISFIVGISISGQTFYTFIVENLERFGALKAIGSRSRDLIAVILFQALLTGLTGYGLGVGLSTLVITLAKLRLPDYASVITVRNLGMAFVMVLVIAGVSGYIGVRKVIRVEPFDIFRG
ncbi:MAG TPA: ABC transporter permease [Myxococcota bacterium]|nr:ABC transporter permease [Myxococcota bacterium]